MKISSRRPCFLTSQFRHGLFFLFACSLLLESNVVVVVLATTAQSNKDQSTTVIEIPMQQNIPPDFLAFDIPQISVWFQTTVPSSVLSAEKDSESDMEILRNDMAIPLKQIVGTFVKEHFAMEIAQLEKVQSQDTVGLPPFVFDFVSLDFLVLVEYDFLQNEGRRNVQEGSSSSSSSGDGLLHMEFYSEFVGSAYFVAPVAGDVGATEIPSQEFMTGLMLGWLDHSLTSYNQILEDLKTEQSPILNNINDFRISTISSPSSETSAITSAQKGKEKDGNWVHAVIAAIVILACMSTVAFGAIYFRHSPDSKENSIDDGEPTTEENPSDHSKSGTSRTDGISLPSHHYKRRHFRH